MPLATRIETHEHASEFQRVGEVAASHARRIAGLKALLKEWELSGDLDLDYIRGLKARLLSVKNQLKNMCGHDGSEGMDDW